MVGVGADRLGIQRDAALVSTDGVITFVGAEKERPQLTAACEHIDAQGALVTPGLIDCHTHTVFGGSRPDEFFERLSGVDYETIAARGGGIQNTVRATRASDTQSLSRAAIKRLDRFKMFGITTIEIKSGYGLSFEDEMRILEIAQGLEHDIDVITTFLGAHTIPKEYQSRREDYIKLVVEKMLPEVKKRNLANACDIFCENGAFSFEEMKTIIAAAKVQGFSFKAHVDQLSHQGATEWAIAEGALSVDHLEYISDEAIDALAKSASVAVLLPGRGLFVRKIKLPARA